MAFSSWSHFFLSWQLHRTLGGLEVMLFDVRQGLEAATEERLSGIEMLARLVPS
jgi:hypothetical protein